VKMEPAVIGPQVHLFCMYHCGVHRCVFEHLSRPVLGCAPI
jgi:hypothetical protein